MLGAITAEEKLPEYIFVDASYETSTVEICSQVLQSLERDGHKLYHLEAKIEKRLELNLHYLTLQPLYSYLFVLNKEIFTPY